MPVSCLEEGQTLTVRISGEIDHHAAKALMTEVGRQIDTILPASLVMDLGKVTFMDSSGIAVVLRTWKRMQEIGGALTLCAVPPYAAKVLKAAGVDKLISLTQ